MTEFRSNLQVICLESQAFYALVEEVVGRLNGSNVASQPEWVNDDEAMKLLGITSKTTLQKYRDEGRIRFSQPSKKVILYNRDSILSFLERHAISTFQ